MNSEQQFTMSERIGHYEACHPCHGLGVRAYANTTTWRGGIGGQAITSGVCDTCWGSGKHDYPWPSHREFEQLKKHQCSI